jgi:hypothetical protein
MPVVNEHAATLPARPPAGPDFPAAGRLALSRSAMHKHLASEAAALGPARRADAGGELSAGAVKVSGGTVQIDGVLDPAAVNVDVLGTISGIGKIIGNVTNDGTVVPGDATNAPGELMLIGDYIQNNDGYLVEGIDSASNGLLSITGDATLGGTLDINLLGGFTPTNGETFELIGFSGTETGAFSGISAADRADWTVLYQAGQVDLEFTGNAAPTSNTPEPNFAWLYPVLALALVLGWRRKRAHAA